MADIYYDHTPDRAPMGANFFLPIGSLKKQLRSITKQSLIPFLGAGASLPLTPLADLGPPSKPPTEEQLDQICNNFGIMQNWSRRFLEVAIQLAQLLDQKSKLEFPEVPQWAPSSWQLARQLAKTVALEPYRPIGDNLKRLLKEQPERGDYANVVRDAAEILGLSSAVPQLLTVASFFSAKVQREQLLTDLDERFRSVTNVTEIQKVIAAHAKAFVGERNKKDNERKKDVTDKHDYLILTTNYDQLMESWLAEELKVPTCVVTVDRNQQIRARFMHNVRDLLGLDKDEYESLESQYKVTKLGTPLKPRDFMPTDKKYSLALVYKIHGCPVIDTEQGFDNLVISDRDYILFIQKNGTDNSLIPIYVTDRIVQSSLLFLGYSFSDWNVRSLYQQTTGLRLQKQYGEPPTKAEGYAEPSANIGDDEAPDYIVMKTYGDAEHHLFKHWPASILVTDLNHLADLLSRP